MVLVREDVEACAILPQHQLAQASYIPCCCPPPVWFAPPVATLLLSLSQPVRQASYTSCCCPRPVLISTEVSDIIHLVLLPSSCPYLSLGIRHHTSPVAPLVLSLSQPWYQNHTPPVAALVLSLSQPVHQTLYITCCCPLPVLIST